MANRDHAVHVTPIPDPRSLLDPDPPALELDREAERDEPRPGAWIAEAGYDLRRLSQDATDLLIRAELLVVAPVDERDELVRAFGDPATQGRVEGLPAPARQRGGLDSDPLVRVLARRAWGDRDRRWWDERGCRAGEALAPIDIDRDDCCLAVPWSIDPPMVSALHDARPGDRVLCKLIGSRSATSDVALPVSCRARPDPDPIRPRGTKPIGRQRILGGVRDLSGAMRAIEAARSRHRATQATIHLLLSRGATPTEIAEHLVRQGGWTNELAMRVILEQTTAGTG